MKQFKLAAVKVLQQASQPLHVKEITKRAIKFGYLVSDGQTPKATMNALLITDVNKNGEKSIFQKTAPATFQLRDITAVKESKKIWAVSKNVSTKQKGDIAESRIAELLVLYGSESLSCYKPISDDDGIDIIVKKKKGADHMFLQVKSRYGQGLPTVFTADVKKSTLISHKNMFIVFCFFDTEQGDLSEYLWLVPAEYFLKYANKLQGGERRGFVAGVNKKESNKWDKYLIEKNDLAEKVISYINKK